MASYLHREGKTMTTLESVDILGINSETVYMRVRNALEGHNYADAREQLAIVDRLIAELRTVTEQAKALATIKEN